MLKIRVKRVTDDEVEITVLPKERDQVPPSPSTIEPTETALEPLRAYSPERLAATRLQSFLKDGNGTWSASGCRDLLKEEGFNVESMNFSRVMKYADIHHYQQGGKSWWFLAAPVRGAAAELKKFLSNNGECLETECREHLWSLGFAVSDERKQWFVLNYAGAVATEKDGMSWWSLSPEV